VISNLVENFNVEETGQNLFTNISIMYTGNVLSANIIDSIISNISLAEGTVNFNSENYNKLF